MTLFRDYGFHFRQQPSFDATFATTANPAATLAQVGAQSAQGVYSSDYAGLFGLPSVRAQPRGRSERVFAVNLLQGVPSCLVDGGSDEVLANIGF